MSISNVNNIDLDKKQALRAGYQNSHTTVNISFPSNVTDNQFLKDNSIDKYELSKILQRFPNFLEVSEAERIKMYDAYVLSLNSASEDKSPETDVLSAPTSNSNTVGQSKYSDLVDKFLTKEQNQTVLNEIFEHNHLTQDEWNKFDNEKCAAIYTKQVLEMAVRKEFGIEEETWHKGLSDDKRKEYTNKFINKLVYETPDENGNIIGEDAWNNLPTNMQDKYKANFVQKIANASNRDINKLPQILQHIYNLHNFKSELFDKNGNNIKLNGEIDTLSKIAQNDKYKKLLSDNVQEKKSAFIQYLNDNYENIKEEEIQDLQLALLTKAKNSKDFEMMSGVFAKHNAVMAENFIKNRAEASEANRFHMDNAVKNSPVEEYTDDTLNVIVTGYGSLQDKDKSARNVIQYIGLNVGNIENTDNARKLFTEANRYADDTYKDNSVKNIQNAKIQDVRATLMYETQANDAIFNKEQQIVATKTVMPTLKGEVLKTAAQSTIDLGKSHVTEAAASVASQINKEDQNAYHEAFWNTNNETVQNILTNQLGDYHVDNQKAIYERTMSSEYDSVLENAANNICKLDDSIKDWAVEQTKSLGKDNVTNSIRTEITQSNNTNAVNTSTYATEAQITNKYNTVPNSITLTPATKEVVNEIKFFSGQKIPHDKAIEMFKNLSRKEQVEILHSLPANLFDKLPILVCEFFPDLIPAFVGKGKGIQIINSCSAKTVSIAIRCMQTGSNETKKQLRDMIASRPEFFAKGTQKWANETLYNGKKQDDNERKPFNALS